MDALVIVAHPDDEVIWSGGLILRHPDWRWQVLSLCREDDQDRAPRFARAAEALGVAASISSLDDSPTLAPLSPELSEIKEIIRSFVPGRSDIILTHGERGEYTRHTRHEQVHRAVREMVESGELLGELICFAYEDCGGECSPHPTSDADISIQLTPGEHRRKLDIIESIYGFHPGSFEYGAAGERESFQLSALSSQRAAIVAELTAEKANCAAPSSLCTSHFTLFTQNLEAMT